MSVISIVRSISKSPKPSKASPSCQGRPAPSPQRDDGWTLPLRQGALSLLAGTVLCSSVSALPPGALTIPIRQAPSGHFVLDVDLGQTLYATPTDSEGRRTFPFIIDTGASHTALVEMLAHQLGYQRPVELDRSATALTGRFDTQIFRLDHFDYGLGPAPMDSVIVFVEPDDTFSAFGLLAANQLNDAPYTLDFRAEHIRFHSPAPQRRDIAIDQRRRILMGEAIVGRRGEAIHIMLDTGSTHSIANSVLAARMNTINDTISLDLRGVGSRISQRADTQAYIRNFELGSLCFSRLQPVEADLYVFEELGWRDEPALLLGIDALQYASLTLDPQSGDVEVEGRGEFRCRD